MIAAHEHQQNIQQNLHKIQNEDDLDGCESVKSELMMDMNKAIMVCHLRVWNVDFLLVFICSFFVKFYQKVDLLFSIQFSTNMKFFQKF